MQCNIFQGPLPLLLSACCEVFLSKYHLRLFNWDMVSSTNLHFFDNDPLNVPSWNLDDNHMQNDGAGLSTFVTPNDSPGDSVPDMVLGEPKGAFHFFCLYFLLLL